MVYKSLFDLDGRVVLVTGSTSGIGRAIAEAMATFGARVVISSRTPEACQVVAQAVDAAGGEALAIPCDVSDRAQLGQLVQQTLNHWGRIDVLVCNAAVNPHFGKMATASGSSYDKIMDTNVKNVLALCNRVIPQMAARRDGVVIIVSSIAALSGHHQLGLYAISKAAEIQIARNLAVEWGQDNVRVNCIAPGLVRTEFARVLWENPAVMADVRRSPLGRIGEPEEIAGAAVFLASKAGAFVTGELLVVDGGTTIGGALGANRFLDGVSE